MDHYDDIRDAADNYDLKWLRYKRHTSSPIAVKRANRALRNAMNDLPNHKYVPNEKVWWFDIRGIVQRVGQRDGVIVYQVYFDEFPDGTSVIKESELREE